MWVALVSFQQTMIGRKSLGKAKHPIMTIMFLIHGNVGDILSCVERTWSNRSTIGIYILWILMDGGPTLFHFLISKNRCFIVVKP